MLSTTTPDTNTKSLLAAEKDPRLAKAISIFTLAMGLVVLCGWAWGIDALKQLLPGLVTMKANTAAGFALSGISLYLHTLRQIHPAILLARRITAILISLLGLVTLAEYYPGWNAGIDQLLFSEPAEAVLTSQPGRMSSITATNFALIGGALLLMEAGFWMVAQAVTSAVLVFALVPLFGYMFGNLSLIHIGSTTAIAAHTAVGFLILAAGILGATQNFGFMVRLRKTMHAFGFAASLISLVVIFCAASYNFAQRAKVALWVEKTYDAIVHMESFSDALHDFLYHNRGFVITGNDSQLVERNKRRDELFAELAKVRHLTSDNPAQLERLAALDKLVEQRTELADSIVRLRREKGREAADEMVVSGKSDVFNDEIEAKLDEMEEAEKDLLKERQKIAEVIGASSLVTLGVLLMASLLMILSVFRALQREVAERKAAEEDFQRFFDFIPDLMCIASTEGALLKINPMWQEVLGYSEQEILSRPFLDLVHPDDRDSTIKEVKRQLAGEGTMQFTNRYRCKDGSYKWLEWRATPAVEKKLLFASARDITGRRQVEKTLHESKNQLRLLLDSTAEAIYGIDLQGNCTFCNPACLKMLNYQRADDLIGKNMHDLIHYRHADGTPFPVKDCRIYRAFLTGENSHVDDEVLWRADGTSFPVEYWSYPQILDDKMVGAVVSFLDITDRRKSEEIIWKQANFDVLTGLPNRHMFRDRMEQEIRKSTRSGIPIALMFIDLDHFKEVNDTLGHDMGDLLLIEASRRIIDCVRATDIVARMGGDEFTILMTGIDDVSSIERVVQNIIQKLSSAFCLRDEMAYVSASIGISLYPNDADAIEGLFKNADQAMYVAKNQGRNRHSYFTHDLQKEAQARLRLVNDLRGALAANQFMVYFQPIVELATGRINKAEALIRWQHPERGMVSPVEFIPLAEETGLIFEIGDWVFHESMRWAKRWRELHTPSLQISVNKSPVQFYKDGDDHSAWLSHLRKIDLPGQSLVIEITEGLLMESNVSMTGALHTLCDVGIQIALDDFGTGYSSLSYLKKFDIDYLKIDQSFVRDLVTDPSDLALSEAIIVMAHKLGMKVIAEGVETKEQRDLLAAAGCDYAQGYLYSRPVPAAEFEKLLKEGYL